jgi:type I restriction enzyme M protein
MITGEIKGVDKIWGPSGQVEFLTMTVIEQFTCLLFLRRLDETQLLEEKKKQV